MTPFVAASSRLTGLATLPLHKTLSVTNNPPGRTRVLASSKTRG
jgi:hypothetical protein